MRPWFQGVPVLLFLSLFFIPSLAGGEANMIALTTEGLTLQLSTSNGQILGLELFEKGCPLLPDIPGGFRIVDAATGQAQRVTLPLVFSGEQWIQEGALGDLEIGLKMSYEPGPLYIRVHGWLEDLSRTDRMLLVEFSLPLDATGWQWGDHLDVSRPITPGATYDNVGNLAGHPMNIYPFSAVYNSTQGLALGIPLDTPRVFHIRYDHTERDRVGYVISFPLALTQDTKDSPGQGEFEFIIYGFAGQWGFRAAAQKYYDSFPEYYVRRVTEAGNWLFLQDYRGIPALGDFRLKFNETPVDYQMDQVQGIVSFRYTAPSEKSIAWLEREREPEPTKKEFLALLERSVEAPDEVLDYDHKIVPLNFAARSILNSGIYDPQGELFPYGWHAFGPMVYFAVNCDPRLPSPNYFEIQLEHLRYAEREAREAGGVLGGIYIDNLDWAGGLVNYRREHFATAQTPLIWDPQRRVGQAMALVQHQYVMEMAKIARQENKLVLGNIVFPERGLFFIPGLDIPAGEVGTGFGEEERDFMIRRTLVYRKPWTLLLTEDLPYGRIARWDYAQREELLKLSMFYGIFANVLGLRPTPEEWETYRPLFRKYMPIIQALDRVGWAPIALATSSTEDVQLERYGDFQHQAGYFTLRNSGATPHTAQITIDLKALGLLQKEDILVFDLLQGVYCEKRMEDTNLVVEYSFNAKETTAWLVGTPWGIWTEVREELLYQAQRALKAATTLGQRSPLLVSLNELEALLIAEVTNQEELADHLRKIAHLAEELKPTVAEEVRRFRNPYFEQHFHGEILYPLEVITECIARLQPA
ncbi:MAG TPA: hypothetical protein GXX57_06760 [Firmicutes bacterium]|nr:hypothetical protein [Bacillota bacterium]